MMNKISSWRFWVPLLFQSALILVVPAQAIYTHFSGKTIVLQTLPVDPYDLLRGRSLRLRYNISRVDALERLPGWETIVQSNRGEKQTAFRTGTRFYVILQAPAKAAEPGQPPRAWKPVAVSHDRPSDLPSDRVALEGKQSIYPWIDYGLETYYFPQEQGDEIKARIGQTLGNSNRERPFAVEVKVDSQGHAIPLSLWIGNNNYRF
ncbi:MAG: GDYXXLXY domain-containing protein [Hydrococcus sp. C42_A2020_068]|nr:GDYXXLXY domain-containing protein [Hydrococcus sp. C42_A2020_068]